MSEATPPFAPGQRVRILHNPVGWWGAHCFGAVYMRFNLVEREVTGTITKCLAELDVWQVVWRPDGWPLPVGVWPGGVVIPAARFALADGLVALGPLFYLGGAAPFPVAVATVRALARFYIERQAPDFVFEQTTRAEALAHVCR